LGRHLHQTAKSTETVKAPWDLGEKWVEVNLVKGNRKIKPIRTVAPINGRIQLERKGKHPQERWRYPGMGREKVLP